MKQAAEEILRKCNPFSVSIGVHSSEYVVSFEDAIEAMKLYANSKLDEAASKSQEMIYDRKDTQMLESGSGLILRDYQICYATAKQSILSLKDPL